MSSARSGGPCENTDRELFREKPDDYYAPSLHVTKEGSIGINVGGTVYVRPLREWHAAIARSERTKPNACKDGCPPQTVCDYCQGVGGKDVRVDKEREGDPFFQPFDCHYDGEWLRCDKITCQREKQCARRTSGPKQDCSTNKQSDAARKELREAFQDVLDNAPLDFVGTGSQASGDIEEREHIERVQRVFSLIEALPLSSISFSEETLKRAREIVAFADDHTGKPVPACYSWVALELSRAIVKAADSISARANVDAWRDYALHQETCAWCAEDVKSCETGFALRETAYQTDPDSRVRK